MRGRHRVRSALVVPEFDRVVALFRSSGCGRAIDVPTEQRRIGYVSKDARSFPLKVAANLRFVRLRTFRPSCTEPVQSNDVGSTRARRVMLLAVTRISSRKNSQLLLEK
jgi:hypothetical protein